ncbi:MAG: element excision factor XisI family protein [Bacteroidota bacterium]
MTKQESYSNILSAFVTDFAEKYEQAPSGLSTIALIDKERHHYQALMLGYNEEQEKFSFVVAFHLDLIEDQVWVQANNTDWDFSNDLLERGVSEKDIVIGWLPENAESYKSSKEKILA